jgi:hypothetical protein
MNVVLDLTCPERHSTSEFPTAVRKLYYNRHEHADLLSMIESYGSPNSGGFHRLEILGTRADVTAWLDLLLEEFPGIKPEIDILKRHIRSEFIRSPMTYRYSLSLKEIKRQHGYNGELYSRPWFWFPRSEFPEKDFG